MAPSSLLLRSHCPFLSPQLMSPLEPVGEVLVGDDGVLPLCKDIKALVSCFPPPQVPLLANTFLL